MRFLYAIIIVLLPLMVLTTFRIILRRFGVFAVTIVLAILLIFMLASLLR